MEDFIANLVSKVGISEEQAKGVFEFLKDNADKVPEWLGDSGLAEQVKDKLPGGLGNLF